MPYPKSTPLSFIGKGIDAAGLLDMLRDDLRFATRPTDETFITRRVEPEATMPNTLREAVTNVRLECPVGTIEEALAELRELWLGHATRYDSWRYQAHLNCPIVSTSFVADVLATAVNTAVESWDQARSAALIEDRLLHWLASTAGMDPDTSTGTFTSGGTQSNLQALYTARERALTQGHRLEDLTVVCSSESHYSISRAANILGLTPNAIYTVPTYSNGSIHLGELSRTLEVLHNKDKVVMCLALTAGTTDLGAIDSIGRSVDLAHKFGVYVHVDCAYGGILLVSPRHRDKLLGIDRADSFSVDFHKCFYQPVACSALIYRNKSDVKHISWHAEYLNSESDERLNLADRSLQTTRRFDALKLWLTLRVHGAEAIGEAFDRCYGLTQHAYALALQIEELEIPTEPNLTTLMLRFYRSGLSEISSKE